MRKAFEIEDREKRREYIRELLQKINQVDIKDHMVIIADYFSILVDYILASTNPSFHNVTTLIAYIYRTYTWTTIRREVDNPPFVNEISKFLETQSEQYAEEAVLIFNLLEDHVLFKALLVINLDLRELDKHYKNGEIARKELPDFELIATDSRRQWRVSMFDDNVYDEVELFNKIIENLTKYVKKKRKELVAGERPIHLLYSIYYYLIYRRPACERNFLSVLKLLNASRKNGSRLTSPFMRIMEEEGRKNPDNKILSIENSNLKAINNEDVEYLFDYAFWYINYVDSPDKDELIGLLHFYKQYDKKAMIKRSGENVNLLLQPASGEEADAYRKFLEKYTPEAIKDKMDQFIIGQDSAKKNVSAAVYNHLLRCLHPEQRLNKTNVLLIGPSGCGKTEIIRRLKEFFAEEGVDIPIVISDFSGVVATPWKGRNKEEILARLFDVAGKDIEKAQRGIVFLDEFDKIVPQVNGGRRGYDYNGELQGQMLGMLEGTSCQVKVYLEENSKYVEAKILMKTDNILFILAGAFEGLDEIILKNEREKKEQAFGLIANKKRQIDFTDENVTIDTLMEYGIRSELAGRIGYVSVLKPLDKQDMIRILKDAKDNIISKYQNVMFAEDGIDLVFTEDAYQAMADRVTEYGIGARGLNAILHEVLADVMFNAPSIENIRKVVINADKVNGVGEAIYLKTGESYENNSLG